MHLAFVLTIALSAAGRLEVVELDPISYIA